MGLENPEGVAYGMLLHQKEKRKPWEKMWYFLYMQVLLSTIYFKSDIFYDVCSLWQCFTTYHYSSWPWFLLLPEVSCLSPHLFIPLIHSFLGLLFPFAIIIFGFCEVPLLLHEKQSVAFLSLFSLFPVILRSRSIHMSLVT